jgi:hypothetical protein
MNEQTPLSAALRAVAEDDERLGTSHAVHVRLMAELNAMRERRRRRRLTAYSLAAAAALFFAIVGPAWKRTIAPAATDVVAGSAAEVVTEFYPLAYSNVPATGSYIVRMDVPGSTVKADVIVGYDGLARAVRFVGVVGADQP